MPNMTNRKPHSGNAGYKAELKAVLGGHVVIYDANEIPDIDTEDRWIVMHEPSGQFVSGRSLAQAREVMKGVAKATTYEEAAEYADILPQDED